VEGLLLAPQVQEDVGRRAPPGRHRRPAEPGGEGSHGASRPGWPMHSRLEAGEVVIVHPGNEIEDDVRVRPENSGR